MNSAVQMNMINYWYVRIGKRWLDVMIATVALVIFLPLILVISVIIRIHFGSPIFFCQPRPGLNTKPFTIYKFRTMTDEHDRDGNLLPDEKRLTRVGNFLRSTSLDELPELINVLRGDMSLVGPRPWLIKYLERYTPEQMRRHEVRPGITGLAQISGRNALVWKDRLEKDVWYVDHLTPWLDIKILVLTIFKVLIRDGINPKGQATTSEFTGID